MDPLSQIMIAANLNLKWKHFSALLDYYRLPINTLASLYTDGLIGVAKVVKAEVFYLRLVPRRVESRLDGTYRLSPEGEDRPRWFEAESAERLNRAFAKAQCPVFSVLGIDKGHTPLSQIDVLPIRAEQFGFPAAGIDGKVDQGLKVRRGMADQPCLLFRRDPPVAGLGRLDTGEVGNEVRQLFPSCLVDRGPDIGHIFQNHSRRYGFHPLIDKILDHTKGEVGDVRASEPLGQEFNAITVFFHKVPRGVPL